MILVLNCGSQSIKYKLFKDDLRLVEKREKRIKKSRDYNRILERELNRLKIFESEIKKVCHRVVHGGEKFNQPVKVNNNILKELKKYAGLAPLHNPYNILGIEISRKIFPKAAVIAFFDTGFYKELPEKVFRYALPESLSKKYGFRKFGFHGLSHEYVAGEAAKIFGKPLSKLKIISCHLGGGCSLTAIKSGKAIDTSMGFTPLEGLVMMTRGGDIDPGIILELSEKVSLAELTEILNKNSGMKGLCGVSEMKKVLQMAGKGDKKAKLALDIFTYRLQKYIGSYFAVLRGCDLLVFTGSIGVGSEKIRKMVTDKLEILKNTKILAIETDEEFLMATKSKKI
jgi:acetate kinase